MTPPAGFPSPVVDSILSALSEISASPESYSFDIPKRFSRYATRLHLLLNQFLRSLSENPSPAVHTALKGVAADLIQAQETLSVYRQKSKIYVLINCQSLCKSLQERAVGIGGWLALLDLEVVGNPDLRKKIGDLSKDMQQSLFKVTENEERVFCTLLKEAQGRETSKAVQSAIIMDLARALGTASDNHTELAEQVKLLKTDLTLSNSTSERRILMSLERICETCSICPNIAMGTTELNFEEDAHIPPFKNFLCPLTKEVMKDPVVLESSQTYERTAIQYWFDRCIEDGRDPTCPVTGQVLKNLEQKSNIGLAGAIEEWISRNVEIQVKSALQYLGEDCSYPVDSVERVLDNMYNISEEHPSSRYRIRNSGVVALIVKMLKNSSKSTGSGLRSKALLVLVSMAKDDESKQIMIDEGMTRLAKHSLTGSMEMEQENAVKLLVEFSRDEGYCTELASQKGALVLLSSMAGNIENPTLSNLAEEVLLNMEKVEENVQHLAAAGRFQPLLTRLCKGEEDVKIQMAALIGNMTLPSNGKELIARQGAKVLIKMLLSKPEMKASSLRAMHNLSTLDDNACILVDFGAFPPLTNILFDQTLQDSSDLKELAASTIANIASKHGHWELAVADNEGHSLQSEFIIHKLLKLLPCVSSLCQVAVLRVLYGIVSSPQATESAAIHIKTGEGIHTIIPFLGHSDSTNRLYAFRLTSLLSRKLAEPLANELRASNNLSLLKQTLMNSELPFGERSEAARILANLHLSDQEVKTICETSFIPWIVTTLKDQKGNYSSRSMIEGLLGILLHFTKSPDPLLLNAVQENHLMIIFRDHLTFPSPRLKRRAALGLKYMSESSRFLVTAKDLEPQLPPGFCASLTFMCGKAPICTAACSVHGAACNEDSGFCLIRGQAVKPLVDILNDENRDVQIAAAEALSTLLLDPYSLKNSVEELEKLSVVDTVMNLFTEVRPGLLQERLVWMVERFLRVESRVQLSSMDQDLVKALVEAFKHGTPGAKRYAQDALTNLKQISGVSGRNSNINRGRRL